MPAVPIDTDVETDSQETTAFMPSLPAVPSIDDPFDIGPDVPAPAAPAPAAPRKSNWRQPQTEEEWRRGLKRAQMQLKAATEEVENFKPTLDKILTATGLNIRESAVGVTKQAVGNLTRSFAEIVAPEKPHEAGSFKSFLQVALDPVGLQGYVLGAGSTDPQSMGNVIRQAGVDLAAEGSDVLQKARELTEGLGGGQATQLAGAFGATAGASAPALLAAPLGLTPAAIAAGLQGYGNNVDSFKTRLMELDPNLTEQQAYDKAMFPAAVTGAVTGLLTRGFGGTERFIDQLVKQGVKQAGFKAALREVLKSATLEAPEEFLDQLAQGFVEKGYIDPNKRVQDIFSDAAVAGLQGFALGGVTTGALSGAAHGGAKATSAIEGALERNRLRREIGPEGQLAIQRVIERKGRPNAEGEISPAGALPAQQGQPAPAIPAVQAAPGVAQRGGQGQAGQAQTSQVVTQAINDIFPKPPPPPAAPVKKAVFGGYIGDSLPSYKIPGARPGWFRDVSAETATQLGYELPAQVPTLEQWVAAGRPPTMSLEANVDRANLSPAATPEQPNNPVLQLVPEVERRLPGMTVQQIAQGWFTDPTIRERASNFPGGWTRFMHAVGAMAKTPEDVAALRTMGEETSTRVREMMSAGRLDEAMATIGTQPAEAYEYATGVKIDGTPKWDTMQNLIPGYRPSVPDAKWSAAHPNITQQAASPATQQQSLAERAGRAFDYSSLITTDEAGYTIIDEDKLLAALRDGSLEGGPVNNALLEYFLSRSDLHPRHGIRLLEMTPQQAALVFGTQAFHGRFYTETGNNVGTVQISLLDENGQPVSQAVFVMTLLHELVHNSVTSKLKTAPDAMVDEAHDIYQFVKEKAQGTIWQEHNALSSVDEFFSEALSNGAFMRFLTGLDYGGTGKATVDRKNSVLYRVLDFVKRLLNIPNTVKTITGQSIDVLTALDQAFATASRLETVQRQASQRLEAAAARAENLSPAGPPPGDDNLAQLQVNAGAAELGRIAESIVAQREQAGVALEGLAYERRQYRMATAEMRRLTGLARASFEQQGLDPEVIAFPDPTAGVGINEESEIGADDTFINALTVANVPHNPENVRSMQEEIFFEQAARRFNSLHDQADTLQSVVTFYQQLGVAEEEIKKVQTELEKVLSAADRLGDATLNGTPVSDRANEMVAARDMRQERVAQVRSLSLEPVAGFFGREVGAYRSMAERLQAAAAQLANAQLTKEQRASIYAQLAATFEDHDFFAALMRNQVEERIPAINKRIRELLETIADAKVQKGMAEVLEADVAASLREGATGLSGNLRSQAENRALQERISAIRSFALGLSNNLETNRQLFDFLTDPGKPRPVIPPGQTGLNADPVTIEMILNEVSRNPDFQSAVLRLIGASDTRLENLPITGIEEIEAALAENTPEGNQRAETRAQRMMGGARSDGRAANASLRDALGELDKLEIERRSLQEGKAMFDSLSASPEFNAARDRVNNSPYGLVEPMVEQNHQATTFKAFGAKGLPSHGELRLDASMDPSFKSQAYQSIALWHKAAQDYVNAYDTAEFAHQQDPLVNPSPASLGYDLPKVRGLRDATRRFVPGSFLQLSLLSDKKRWGVPWLARKLNKVFLFRQHDLTSKLVGGITGTDLRARLSDFVNHFLEAQAVRDQFRNLPDRLHQAMRSHPDLQMNMDAYRRHFNEMAHWGRQFGSPLKAGFVLPLSGRTVTKEDMAFLDMERDYQEQLRRRVTESNVTQGVRVRTLQNRTLVRPGAFVGDQGTPRFINHRAELFIPEALAAYNEAIPQGAPPGVGPAGGFDPTTNIGVASQNPVAQFWNQRMDLVLQHVLDVRRQDRSMTLTPGMIQAQTALANDWMLNGVPQVDSLAKLVDALVNVHPPVPGQNTRDVVVNALNAELRQYRDHANRMQTERQEQDQARQSRPAIAFSAQNEFTKPAAQLELPSALYDYGAVTPAEHLVMGSRANHERVLAYATAVARAITELQTRLNRLNSGDINEQQATLGYGSLKEVKDALDTLRAIQRDFEQAYSQGAFTNVPRGAFSEGLGFLTSAILALPTVGLRNMTQGQFEVYLMSRAMGSAGHTMSLARALAAMPATVARFALHALDGAVKRTNLGIEKLTGTNRHFMEGAVKAISDAIFRQDFQANSARVGELGLDNREGLLRNLKRLFQETTEFANTEDLTNHMAVKGVRVGRAAALAPRAIRALFDAVGVQQYDFAINATSLSTAQLLQQRMKDVAMNYGAAREAQGLTTFDPTNPAWALKPTEWGSFLTQAENQNALARFQQFLESGPSAEGFQLERAMWEYYQAKKAGQQDPPLMTDKQFDSMTRKILADFNASTPANRPSYTSASPIARNLLLLQGYPSDLLLKLIDTTFGGTADRGKLAKALTGLPTSAIVAFAAVLIGVVTSGLTGAWEKYIRGRQPTLATVLDKDFRSSWGHLGEGLLALGAAQMSYIGDLVLWARNEVRGNRGFDPTGRILAVSTFTRIMNALRGAWGTARGSGGIGSAGEPLYDVGRSTIPFWIEVERLLHPTKQTFKQGERLVRGEATLSGLAEPKPFGAGGIAYGPTTITRRLLGEAVGDWFAAQQAGDKTAEAAALERAKGELGRLVAFHEQKYLAAGKSPIEARKLAERDGYDDYQGINPVQAGFGKRPTQAQFDQLMTGLTGDRGAAVNRSIAAWKAGNQALFGRPGSITREEVDANRATGVGGPIFGIGRSVRLPSLMGASNRNRLRLGPPPAPIRSIRASLARQTKPRPATGTRLRSARRRRAAAPRPPRFRSPRLRRRTRPPGQLASRLRSSYAGA